MKLVIAIATFFLALSLPYTSTAAEDHKIDPAVCTAGQTENCNQSKGESHGPNHAQNQGQAHGGGHHDLEKKMNSLFPEKKSRNAEVAVAPMPAKIVSPKFLSQVSGNMIKLEWSATPGATHYHVQVATDPNFKWLVANKHFVKGNSFDVTPVEPGKRYFWRVAAVKDDNISMHSKSGFVSSAFDTK